VLPETEKSLEARTIKLECRGYFLLRPYSPRRQLPDHKTRISGTRGPNKIQLSKHSARRLLPKQGPLFLQYEVAYGINAGKAEACDI
jgi:hypothetical protein